MSEHNKNNTVDEDSLQNYTNYTLEEIGEEIGFTKEGARLVEARAIKKFKEEFEKMGLDINDYLSLQTNEGIEKIQQLTKYALVVLYKAAVNTTADTATYIDKLFSELENVSISDSHSIQSEFSAKDYANNMGIELLLDALAQLSECNERSVIEKIESKLGQASKLSKRFHEALDDSYNRFKKPEALLDAIKNADEMEQLKRIILSS